MMSHDMHERKDMSLTSIGPVLTCKDLVKTQVSIVDLMPRIGDIVLINFLWYLAPKKLDREEAGNEDHHEQEQDHVGNAVE